MIIYRKVAGKARYICFACRAVVDGDDTRWLCDEGGLGYPFCSAKCINQPWPLSEARDGQHLRIWDNNAFVPELYH
jgi:hypothetical protein